MTRPPRVDYQGAWHHVMNRAPSNGLVFPSDSFREVFLALLHELHARFGVEVHAYALLDHRYHLLLRTPRANLARAMRHLGGVYTQYYNRLTNREGPLFRGRYRSVLLDPTAYLLRVSAFIHRHALSHPEAKSDTKLIRSSYRSYIGCIPPPSWLFCSTVLSALSSANKHERYRALVEQHTDHELQAFYDAKQPGWRLGTDGVLARLQRQTHPENQVRQPVASIPAIVEEVGRYFGVEPCRLRQAHHRQRKASLARDLAMTLTRDTGCYELREIASVFGLGNPRSVSTIVGRLKRRCERDEQLKRCYADLCGRVLGAALTVDT